MINNTFLFSLQFSLYKKFTVNSQYKSIRSNLERFQPALPTQKETTKFHKKTIFNHNHKGF